MMLKNLNYPLDFKFKITTISSDFNITDRSGNYVAYVREKIFKLKDDVIVYNNESKSQELFRIKANQWIDFNASFSITDLVNGKNLGRLARRGMRSLWKSQYDIIDENDHAKYQINEDDAWVKVLDGVVDPCFRNIYRLFSESVIHRERSRRKRIFPPEKNALPDWAKILTG